MSRRNAREDAFRLIFQSLINMEAPEKLLENYFRAVEQTADDEEPVFVNEPRSTDNSYVEGVVKGVFEKSAELDKIIGENLVGWSADRISKVSAAVMRVALYEIIYMEDVPASVAANEAVELAKRYDGAECGAFVNGALGSAIKKLGVNE